MVRDGVDRRVPVDQVVVGDLVRVAPGDQVVADGRVVQADGLAVDEANLTGESEPAVRGPGEPVWSGSFAVEGAALFEATAVGQDSRAAARGHGAGVPPSAVAARAGQRPPSAVAGRPGSTADDRPRRVGAVPGPGRAARVQAVTAGVVNLVPEGLILLISVTAAVSAFKMAQRGVLAQQLNAIESLASVDVVLTDKTGTLTEPRLRVVGLVRAEGTDEATLARELAAYAAAVPSRNPTLEAIAEAEPADAGRRRVVGQVPFSSRRRWSALDLGDERLVLGAPERFAGADPRLDERAREEAAAGRRVLALGRTEAPLPASGPDPAFPRDVRVLGLVVLAERLRPNAAATVAFFAAEGVNLKVLSGDAPATAGAIAHDAGVPGSAPALDGEALPPKPADLREAILSAPAVGRISPEGKRAVVDALAGAGSTWRWSATGSTTSPRSNRHAWRSPRARGRRCHARSPTSCSFATISRSFPPWSAEGRQILRNIQRVARLFVTKAVFTAVLGLAVGIPTATFPLLPRQFTVASTVTIGIPAFVLALAPSSGPWRPERYLSSVARFAIPAGLAVGIGIVSGYLLARYGFDLGLREARTVATGTVVVCGLAVVIRLEAGERGRRRLAGFGLCAAMALLFALALAIPLLREFYELSPLGADAMVAWAVGSALGVTGMPCALRLLRVP